MLGRFIILITAFFMLQACASTRIAQQLQSGKISFEDGNYKSAFHKLLPLAAEGDASAEYAVGYMYYFGYGTTQDTESGKFWMNKAAEQHYEPAIKALDYIKKNKISEEPTQQLQMTDSTKTDNAAITADSDAILKALAENPAKQPVLSSDETDSAVLAQSLPPAVPETIELTGEGRAIPAKQLTADFTEEHKKKYTLQLIGSFNLADIKRMQNRLHLKDQAYCAKMARDGRDWYVLGYGQYPAPYLAKLALDDLPANLREMKPWVREVSSAKVLA